MYVYIKHIYKPICNYVYLHTYKNIGVQGEHFRYCQWYPMVLDIIKSKIFYPTISKVTWKAPTNICKVSFPSKGVELIAP